MKTRHAIAALAVLAVGCLFGAPENAPAPVGAAERARRIRIPELKMERHTPNEAIRLLRELAVAHDPDKEGIGFVLWISPAGRAGMDRPAVSLTLTDVTLERAIHYVCTFARLHYRYDRNAVIVADAPLPRGGMETRAYPIAPGAMKPRPTRPKPKRID